MVCTANGQKRAAPLDRTRPTVRGKLTTGGRPSRSELGIVGSASLIVGPMDVLGVEGGFFEPPDPTDGGTGKNRCSTPPSPPHFARASLRLRTPNYPPHVHPRAYW